ncbi:hypothetical protein PPL_09580 [Heterostelium album PN500]|uniref:Uncharacterized protein n=1 Tax=Heterostelium pallidum (strain ATCC 26659 / Pp 5 / PN500) TaxID=670386 RepID=D3BNQ9_HETP5|nr:hypothetical protein PPL_09580 [Heterostelium album PN500]EFA76828.1 hypothetical protein PPL_09580 [Heterostelium album PN500]|eukprot:XP_020428960.1 hypothetical protein PPL_09580 [Heterostelium album PN500]
MTNPGLSSSPTMILSAKKTDFLVKILAGLTVIAIARSFVFTFAVDEGFAMSQVGDLFAFLIEVGQMVAVMMAVSGGKFIPFFMFRRAYNTVSSERVSAGANLVGQGLSSDALDAYFGSDVAIDNNIQDQYYQSQMGSGANVPDSADASSMHYIDSNKMIDHQLQATEQYSINININSNSNINNNENIQQQYEVQLQQHEQDKDLEMSVNNQISVCPTNGGS